MDDEPPRLAFTPVPLRCRRDGWTPTRQSAFIAALAERGCIDEACRTVGLSQQGAYRLRAHIGADSFVPPGMVCLRRDRLGASPRSVAPSGGWRRRSLMSGG
jgi:hypothetical protein